MPLIEHYKGQGSLREIDGQREISLVTEAMLRALGTSIEAPAQPKE